MIPSLVMNMALPISVSDRTACLVLRLLRQGNTSGGLRRKLLSDLHLELIVLLCPFLKKAPSLPILAIEGLLFC